MRSTECAGMLLEAPAANELPTADRGAVLPDQRVEAGPGPADREAISGILAILRERTGTDFSRYRPATIHRRILNRMIVLGLHSLQTYLALLRATEQETPLLLQRLTIKVSRFYRNRVTFDPLRSEVIPRLARERDSTPIRIWSAGCGCGEEAYTLAMLLDEAGHPGLVHATDVDPLALDAAHQGVYPREALQELPAELARRYLEPVPGGRCARYRVRDALRARVRFAHHDLTANVGPPQDRFELVCCRNVLIYLEREVHERALARLRESLADGGYLCLGESEWPLAHLAATLDPIDKKSRIFRAAGAGP